MKSDVDLEFLRKNIFSSKSSTSETDENELLAARLQREEKFRQELEAELQRQKAESSKGNCILYRSKEVWCMEYKGSRLECHKNKTGSM